MVQKIVTSESVTRGHPDKVCDQISDYLLDEFLAHDPNSRCAIECMATPTKIIIAGEVTSSHTFNVKEKVTQVLNDIGYGTQAFEIENLLTTQSKEIAQGVDENGAGDQGTVFGYATNETLNYLPLSYALAQQLTNALFQAYKEKLISNLGPDGKAQVSVVFENQIPLYVDNVIIAQQHTQSKNQTKLKEEITEFIIKPVLNELFIKNKTNVFINQTGSFILGGPQADCGLTGRKIIVDTYGGVSRHGGGAFSGKDPTKVDRSAAYMARYLCVQCVKQKLCEKCEIGLSYCIGRSEPTAIEVNTFNTGDEAKVRELISTFDLTPKGIISFLELNKPIYYKTAQNGHFGKNFKWDL